MNLKLDGSRVEFSDVASDRESRRILVRDGDKEYLVNNMSLTPDVQVLIKTALDRGLPCLWVDGHPQERRLRVYGAANELFDGGVSYICFAAARTASDASQNSGWVFVIDYQSARTLRTSFQKRYASVLIDAGLTSSTSKTRNVIVPADLVSDALDLIDFRSTTLRSASEAELRIPTTNRATLEERCDELRRRGRLRSKPMGQATPRRIFAGPGQMASFERCAEVAAWTLQRAVDLGARCEHCRSAAPFKRSNDEPFLEVHHITPLSHEGSDTVDNTAALCPNCHREAHLGKLRVSLKETLIRWRQQHP